MKPMPWSERIAWGVFVLVMLVPIWWGGDGRYPWDNSIAPAAVLKAIAAKFGNGFFMTYGPVPYYLTAVPFVGILGVAKLTGELGRPTSQYPWGFDHPEFMMSALSTAAHLVTLVLGVAIVAMSLGRAPGGESRRAGWLVPIAFLASPVFAYYARTSNVDVHYLFWLWAGVTCLERWDGSVRRLVAASAAAALALCSKEQAGPAAVVVILAAVTKALFAHSRSVPLRLARAFGVGAASLVAYALAWRLPFNLSGWRVHHEFLFGEAKYARDFPATVQGFLALAQRALEQFPVALGWLSLAGLVLAVVLRVSFRGLGLRALVVAAYVIGFLGVIGYCYERFLLPLLFLSVPIAVRGWDALFERIERVWLVRGAVMAVFVGLAFTGGPSLSWVMLNDPRLAVERWVRAQVPADALIEMAGNPHYQPRFSPPRRVLVVKADSLRLAPRAPIGDVVLISGIDAYAFESDSVIAAHWLEPLRDGSSGHARKVFQLSPLSRFTRGLEIPAMTAYVRQGRAAPTTP